MTWKSLFWDTAEDKGERPTSGVILFHVASTLMLMALAVALCVWELHYPWNFGAIWEERMLLFSGWVTTVMVSAVALITSTLLGFALALAQRQPFLPLRYFAKTWVELIRALPLVVLILLVWYGFGGVFRWPFEYRYVAGISVLTLFEGAYISEIFRAGIESVSQSQREAALAVGFTPAMTYRYVIFPQMFRQILPPLAGQFVSLIKDSSLLFVIGVAELTQNAKQVESLTLSSLETYLPVAVGYLILTLSVSLFSRWLERSFRYET